MVITPQQLKHTNLIFLEHRKLSKEVDLLIQQVNGLETVNKNLVAMDSLRLSQLNRCMLQADINDQVINSLNIQLAKKEKRVKKLRNLSIGGFTVAAGLFAVLFIK